MLQQDRLNDWLPTWAAHPDIDLVWVTGSMSKSPAHVLPVSDIDLRFAIRDEAHETLWKQHRDQLFAHCGPYHLMETSYFRALFPPGFIVEAYGHKSSELAGLQPYESRILYANEDFLTFQFPQQTVKSIADSFPMKQTITADFVDNSYNWLLWMVAQCFPRSILTKEMESVGFGFDWNRLEYVKLLYAAKGIQYPARNRDMSIIFTEEERADLRSTQALAHEDLGNPTDCIHIWNRLIEAWMRVLHRLAKSCGHQLDESWLRMTRQRVDVIFRDAGLS